MFVLDGDRLFHVHQILAVFVHHAQLVGLVRVEMDRFPRDRITVADRTLVGLTGLLRAVDQPPCDVDFLPTADAGDQGRIGNRGFDDKRHLQVRRPLR